MRALRALEQWCLHPSSCAPLPPLRTPLLPHSTTSFSLAAPPPPLRHGLLPFHPTAANGRRAPVGLWGVSLRRLARSERHCELACLAPELAVPHALASMLAALDESMDTPGLFRKVPAAATTAAAVSRCRYSRHSCGCCYCCSRRHSGRRAAATKNSPTLNPDL